MAFRRRKSPEPVGNALQAVLNRLDPEGHFEIVRLTKVWPEVVGETIARHTMVSQLKFHTALIKVSRAMWIQELNLMKREILARLVTRLGDDSVRDIRFVIGSLGRRTSVPRPRLVRRDPRKAIALPELKDPELRRAFESLIEAWGRSPR